MCPQINREQKLVEETDTAHGHDRRFCKGNTPLQVEGASYVAWQPGDKVAAESERGKIRRLVGV